MQYERPPHIGNTLLARIAYAGTTFNAITVIAIALAALGTLQATRAARWVLSSHAIDNFMTAYDSWVPMLRALDILKGSDGGRLYEELFFNLKIKFQYLPTSLLPMELIGLFLPLDLWVLNIINLGLYIVNAALLAVLAHVLVRDRGSIPSEYIPIAHHRWILTAAAPAVAFVAGLVFFPVSEALRLGQLQIWIDLAFTATILLWCTGWTFSAGLVLAFACTQKPQFGLFIVWALIWRQWRFLSGYLALLVPIGIISILRYGVHNHIAYLDVLSFISRHGESFLTNNSINGIVNRLLMNGSVFVDPNSPYDVGKLGFSEFAPYNPIVYMATIAGTIAFIAIALLHGVVGHRSNVGPLHLCIAALCFTMAAPVAWHHHYGIMLPLFVVAVPCLLFDASERLRRSGLVLLALSWFLSAAHWPRLTLPPLSGYTGLPPWNLVHAHLFFGAAILLGVMIAAAHSCCATTTGRRRMA